LKSSPDPKMTTLCQQLKP